MPKTKQKIIFYNTFVRKHIKFGVLTPQEIVEMAEIEVCNRELYNVTNRTPVKYGCLDRRLVRIKSSNQRQAY